MTPDQLDQLARVEGWYWLQDAAYQWEADRLAALPQPTAGDLEAAEHDQDTETRRAALDHRGQP